MPDDRCPIAAFLSTPAGLALACGACLLDDAMFLILVAAALALALLARGATRLMAAAGRGRTPDPRG